MKNHRGFGGLDLQEMKVPPPVALFVDNVRHDAVDLIAITGLVEPVPELLCELACCVLRLLWRRCEENPISGIEPVDAPIFTSHLCGIGRRIGRHTNELDLLLHRRLVNQGLDFGDSLRGEWAYVRTACGDKMQDHDLAAEVRKTEHAHTA